MKSATLLIFSLVAWMPIQSAWAQEGYRFFRPGTWEASVGAQYRTSDSNYDSGGSQVELLNGGTYQLVDLDFSSRYTLNRSWALFGSLNSGNAESKGTDATRSGGTLTGGLLGVEWNWGISDFVDVIPRFSYLIPFEKISADQDSVITSEGVDETLLDLHLQAAFESFRIFGSLGYMMRGEGRSNLLPWSAGIEWPFTGFLFGAKLMGYESISDDKDAGSSVGEGERLETLTRVNAGSLKFYSVNPGLVDSDFYLILAMGKSFRLGFQGGLTLTGTNSAAEYHAGTSLTFLFSPAPVRRARPAIEDDNRMSIDPNVDHFREDTSDGVDQNLFRPPPRPRPRVRPRPAAPRPTERDREAEEMQRLQQQLDDAEMTIELKVDPKKKKRK